MAEEEDDRRRRPGPPKKGERGLYAVVFARVTTQEFDQLYELARQEGKTVSATLRRLIRERLRP